MLALALAAVALACAVALLSIEWVSPQPVAHLLGSDWQCSRIAFMTTCSRVHKTTPVVARPGPPSGGPCRLHRTPPAT